MPWSSQSVAGVKASRSSLHMNPAQPRGCREEEESSQTITCAQPSRAHGRPCFKKQMRSGARKEGEREETGRKGELLSECQEGGSPHRLCWGESETSRRELDICLEGRKGLCPRGQRVAIPRATGGQRQTGREMSEAGAGPTGATLEKRGYQVLPPSHRTKKQRALRRVSQSS